MEWVQSQEAGVLGEGGGFSTTNCRSASVGKGQGGSGTAPKWILDKSEDSRPGQRCMLGLEAVGSRTDTDGLWAGIPPHAPRTPMHCSSEPTLPWALAARCPQAWLSSPFPSSELGRTGRG